MTIRRCLRVRWNESDVSRQLRLTEFDGPGADELVIELFVSIDSVMSGPTMLDLEEPDASPSAGGDTAET